MPTPPTPETREDLRAMAEHLLHDGARIADTATTALTRIARSVIGRSAIWAAGGAGCPTTPAPQGWYR